MSRSPRRLARLAGLFYLLTFVTGIPLAFGSARLVVWGDAATTARNLLAHPDLSRLSFASDVIVIACYLAVTALFYALFRPVNRNLSRTASFFSLTGCAIQAAGSAFDLAPLAVLRGPAFAAAFTAAQQDGLALLLLRLHVQLYNAGLVFFGVYCVLIGCLIAGSKFVPRVFGVLMIVAGAAWLLFLWPPLARALYPWILALGILGEGSLTLRLLIAGVNAERWTEQEAS